MAFSRLRQGLSPGLPRLWRHRRRSPCDGRLQLPISHVTMSPIPADRNRGRGAVSNPDSRYAEHQREPVNDGWPQEEVPELRTELEVDTSRMIISRNQSPDIPFDRSNGMSGD